VIHVLFLLVPFDIRFKSLASSEPLKLNDSYTYYVILTLANSTLCPQNERRLILSKLTLIVSLNCIKWLFFALET
jgi:hypothetical protein